MALASATQEAVWLRQLLSDMHCVPKFPTVMKEDNQSAIAISNNPQFHGRTKHVDIKFHFVREQVIGRKIQLEYCPTEVMVADMFTKSLSSEKFKHFRSMLGCFPSNLF